MRRPAVLAIARAVMVSGLACLVSDGMSAACGDTVESSTRLTPCAGEGSRGSLRLLAGRDEVAGPLNPPAGDVLAKLKMQGVCWGAQGEVPGEPVGSKKAPGFATLQMVV